MSFHDNGDKGRLRSLRSLTIIFDKGLHILRHIKLNKSL